MITISLIHHWYITVSLLANIVDILYYPVNYTWSSRFPLGVCFLFTIAQRTARVSCIQGLPIYPRLPSPENHSVSSFHFQEPIHHLGQESTPWHLFSRSPPVSSQSFDSPTLCILEGPNTSISKSARFWQRHLTSSFKDWLRSKSIGTIRINWKLLLCILYICRLFVHRFPYNIYIYQIYKYYAT